MVLGRGFGVYILLGDFDVLLRFGIIRLNDIFLRDGCGFGLESRN